MLLRPPSRNAAAIIAPLATIAVQCPEFLPLRKSFPLLANSPARLSPDQMPPIVVPLEFDTLLPVELRPECRALGERHSQQCPLTKLTLRQVRASYSVPLGPAFVSMNSQLPWPPRLPALQVPARIRATNFTGSGVHAASHCSGPESFLKPTL